MDLYTAPRDLLHQCSRDEFHPVRISHLLRCLRHLEVTNVGKKKKKKKHRREKTAKGTFFKIIVYLVLDTLFTIFLAADSAKNRYNRRTGLVPFSMLEVNPARQSERESGWLVSDPGSDKSHARQKSTDDI